MISYNYYTNFSEQMHKCWTNTKLKNYFKKILKQKKLEIAR